MTQSPHGSSRLSPAPRGNLLSWDLVGSWGAKLGAWLRQLPLPPLPWEQTGGTVPSSGLVQVILECIEQDGHQFTFWLDERALLAIAQLHDRQEPLPLPADMVRDFFWEQLTEDLTLTVQLVTAYGGERVMESCIAVDGDVLCRVRRDWLQGEESLAVAQAHYWLVGQVMEQLQPKMEGSPWVAALLAWIPTAIALVPHLSVAVCVVQEHTFTWSGTLSCALHGQDPSPHHIFLALLPVVTVLLVPFLQNLVQQRLPTWAVRAGSWVFAHRQQIMPPLQKVIQVVKGFSKKRAKTRSAKFSRSRKF
jgi:hypothetical protein